MADTAKQQELLDSFVSVTGVDRGRAQFYLESAAWNLEMAMGSFYEGDPDDDDANLAAVGQSIPEPATLPPSNAKTSAPSGSKRPTNSKFATIGSMNPSDSDSSEEDGQAFYAGGSETSGQQVLGPKKKKNVVENLFKSAREHGAEEVPGDEPAQGRKGKGSTFKGSGYRLGDTEEEKSERIEGEPVMFHKKQVDCVLKLWKDGFSVNDGPLRDFKDPANQDFLGAISKGEVPQELIREARGGEVNLNMEDHRTENYVKPKASLKAFAGEGHTLGSPAPTVVTSSPASKASSPPKSSLRLDESKPTTTIQIRLADGSRLVQKFNLTHRISDIRAHITSSCPQYQGANFLLQTTFPNRELTNETESIETAKLQNAVVVQRMK
ncbi:NSFL1 cofactor p47-like [Mya arenaria]|uniref:NSFL1 cofactor p47-like n=1 Tax=Mya arenaria TaxID=6604 RepID=UPI0022E18285|nr:NSFL1 cofactor p47-like [Mya arenaria]